jgi:hypothetical protein
MIGAVLQVAEPTSAPVTQWPLRIALVFVVVAVIALVLLAMRRGWVRRARAQEGIPAPLTPAEWAGTRGGSAGPTGATVDAQVAVPGVFVGTTAHGDWLDRIVVHDLGVRSRALFEVRPDGLAIWREGARDVFIPTADLRSAGLGRGIAGKAYERDGVLVITWELGGRLMDSGLRADTAEGQASLLQALTGQQDAGEVSA